ncbi:hypothetical protein [Neisseria dentiae]|uniref:hypothetical protein n=1 Tax=Neisseria dentiae TaxID=194197 RepID=UPI0035A029A8
MYQHTIAWYQGEILEAWFIVGAGVCLGLIGLLCHFYGQSIGAKALFVPMMVLLVLFLAIGVPMIYSNIQTMASVADTYQSVGETQFVVNELKRVANFQYLYPMSIAISVVSFAVALALLHFDVGVKWKAWAVALLILGTSFAVIDYFSKERANGYRVVLEQAKK